MYLCDPPCAVVYRTPQVPNLCEDLLSSVDQPLKVNRDKETGKDYLLCDYNRDGDSYRLGGLCVECLPHVAVITTCSDGHYAVSVAVDCALCTSYTCAIVFPVSAHVRESAHPHFWPVNGPFTITSFWGEK